MIKQLSVFIENKKGRLSEVTGYLAEAGINIHALSIADTTDFGILRLIVQDVERAKSVLKDHGLTVKITDVVAVSLEHKSGSLSKVLNEFEKADIFIEYMYAFTSRSEQYDAIVVFCLSDQERAMRELKKEKLEKCKIDFVDADVMNHFFES